MQAFLSIFSTLSFFPVLAFMYDPSLVIVLGALLLHVFFFYSIISLATLLAAVTVALCLAFAFSACVFLFLGKQNLLLHNSCHLLTPQSGGVLLATLGSALLLSGFLTAFAISAYLSGLLVLNLRRSGRGGFRAWSQQVTQILFPSSAHLPVDEDQYASEDSGALDGKDTKDGTNMEPLPIERWDNELKHAT
jgi:hypothetical protein